MPETLVHEMLLSERCRVDAARGEIGSKDQRLFLAGCSALDFDEPGLAGRAPHETVYAADLYRLAELVAQIALEVIMAEIHRALTQIRKGDRPR